MAAEGAKSVGKYVVVVGDDDDPTIPPGEDSDGGYGTDDDDDYDDGVAEEEEDDDERAVARKVDRLLEDVESMPDPEIASDAARVFVAAKREGGHIPVPGFPYTCGYGRGIKITERFHGKFLGWCLLSFRFTPARETDIQHFISSFLQIWISSQRYDLRLCTGWRWQEINVKHIVLSSEGFVKGISLDHESIGEDPDMEIVCSPENHRRLDRCLSRRIPGFESRLISNLRDIPGHGGVSRLSLHHQRITNLNQMLHTAAPAPSPSTGSASSAS